MALKTRKPNGRPSHPCILIEGDEKAGKAQPLHARIVTPSGWTTMGELHPGDKVIGSRGAPTTVLAVHERGERPIYRLTFSDGATVEACDEHLWATWTSSSLHRQYANGPKKGQRNHRPAAVRTTAELRDLVLNGTVVHIPVTGPVQYNADAPLPFDAYALGLLLGDGGLTKPSYPGFTSEDDELHAALVAALPAGDVLTRYGIQAHIKGGGTVAVLRDLGLLGCGSADKFIPDQYMTASPADRLALVQGLLDTDGGMERKSVTYTSVSPQLAAQTQELVRSLGGTCSMSSKETSYRDNSGERVPRKTAYKLTIRLPVGACPFRLPRKVGAWSACRPTFHTPPRRTVREVEYVGMMPARCITVDADDHLYLTDGFAVTHNSWLAAQFTGHDRIGQAYWIDLAEGDGDLYGAVPGADYEIVEHDGTYLGIYGAIADVHAEARRAHEAGERPVLLVIDPIGPLWDLLADWARNRAKDSKGNKKILEDDENAEINVGPTYWNPATDRWRRCMTLLLTFPGVVLLLARGKEVAQIGADGNPVRGKKDYRVEGHKSLCHDVTAWVRLTRGEHPRIVGGRSTKVDMRPESYRPRQLPDFTLEWLLFEALGYDPANARVRDHMELKPGSEAPSSEMAAVIELAVESAETVEQLRGAYEKIRPAIEQATITPVEGQRLSAFVSARKAQLESAAPAERVNGHQVTT